MVIVIPLVTLNESIRLSWIWRNDVGLSQTPRRTEFNLLNFNVDDDTSETIHRATHPVSIYPSVRRTEKHIIPAVEEKQTNKQTSEQMEIYKYEGNSGLCEIVDCDLNSIYTALISRSPHDNSGK